VNVIGPPIFTALNQIRTSLPLQCAQLLDEGWSSAAGTCSTRRVRPDGDRGRNGQCRVWDDCTRFFTRQARFYEALSIYYAMYSKLMDMQDETGKRSMKERHWFAFTKSTD